MAQSDTPDLDDMLADHGPRRRRPRSPAPAPAASDLDDLLGGGDGASPPRTRAAASSAPPPIPKTSKRAAKAVAEDERKRAAARAAEEKAAAQKKAAEAKAEAIAEKKAAADKRAVEAWEAERKAAADKQSTEASATAKKRKAAADKKAAAEKKAKELADKKATADKRAVEAWEAERKAAADQQATADKKAAAQREAAAAAQAAAEKKAQELAEKKAAADKRAVEAWEAQRKAEAAAAQPPGEPGGAGTQSGDNVDLDDVFANHGSRVAMPSDDDPIEDDDAPEAPGGGSSVEGAGHPGGDATTRVPALSEGSASFELPRNPLLDRGARMAFGDGGGGEPGAAGGALSTSADADARVPMRPGPDNDVPAGGSVLESAGQTASEGRMAVGDRPLPPEAGPSKLESVGHPSGGTRFPVSPDAAGAPDAPAGGSLALSADRDERVALFGAPPDESAPSPLAAYGSPVADAAERMGRAADPDDADGPGGGDLALSTDRTERFVFGPSVPADAPAGAELALSTDRTERFGFVSLDSEGPAGSELVLSTDRTERVRWRPVSRAPQGDGGELPLSRDRTERFGRADLDSEGPVGAELALSQDRSDRFGRPPGDEELPPASELALSQDRSDRFGRPPGDEELPPASELALSRDRSDRFGRPPSDEELPPASELALSRDRSDRFGRPPSDEELPPASELALSRDRADRFRRGPADNDLPPAAELALSRERTDRFGYAAPSDLAPGAELPLSRERSDRFGRPPGEDELPPAAELALSRERADRFRRGPQDVDGPASAELVLSRSRTDRFGRPPKDEDLPGPIELALSRSRTDRLGRPPSDDELPPAGELQLSRDRTDRMGRLPGEDELPPGAPLPLSRDRSDRVLRQPRMVEAEDLADVFSPSRDRSDRYGRPSGLFVSSDPSDDFSLSRDAFDRLSPVPAYVDADPAIPDLNTAAFAEAGRYNVREPGRNIKRRATPTGLEDLMPHGGLRGADRMRRIEDFAVDDEELASDGRTPVPPRRVEVLGRARPDERTDAEGYERVLDREKTHRRLEFVFQRYEMLIVRRGIYKLKGVLGAEDFVTRDPVFLAGKVPLGNGMLAQTIAARFGDHATLVDISNQLGRFNFEVEDERLAEAIDGARDTGRAVHAAMLAAVEADKGRRIDKKAIPTVRQGRRKRLRGEFKAVTTDEHVLLVHTEAGEAPPDVLQSPGRSRPKATAAWDLYLERIGWNRAGVWAGVRRRFTASLVTHPQQAAYALFLAYAIDHARVVAPKELAVRASAMRDWLDARRDEFEDPENGFQYAIVHALSMWERMAWVDDAGQPTDEPELRPLPKGFEPTWELDGDREIDQTVIWGSIVASCRQLGIRPWEYLYDLFQAVAADRFEAPEQWTPAAWAKTTRS